jgi:hypothetical protein
MCYRVIKHYLSADCEVVPGEWTPAKAEHFMTRDQPTPCSLACKTSPCVKPRMRCDYGHACCTMVGAELHHDCADELFCDAVQTFHRYARHADSHCTAPKLAHSHHLLHPTSTEAGHSLELVAYRNQLRQIEKHAAQLIVETEQRRQAAVAHIVNGEHAILCVQRRENWPRFRRYATEPKPGPCMYTQELIMNRGALTELKEEHAALVETIDRYNEALLAIGFDGKPLLGVCCHGCSVSIH